MITVGVNPMSSFSAASGSLRDVDLGDRSRRGGTAPRLRAPPACVRRRRRTTTTPGSTPCAPPRAHVARPRMQPRTPVRGVPAAGKASVHRSAAPHRAHGASRSADHPRSRPNVCFTEGADIAVETLDACLHRRRFGVFPTATNRCVDGLESRDHLGAKCKRSPHRFPYEHRRSPKRTPPISARSTRMNRVETAVRRPNISAMRAPIMVQICGSVHGDHDVSILVGGFHPAKAEDAAAAQWEGSRFCSGLWRGTRECSSPRPAIRRTSARPRSASGPGRACPALIPAICGPGTSQRGYPS